MDILRIRMNDQEVGQLRRARSGSLSFTYRQQWLSSSLARPISLSMPLAETPYKGAIVHNYFENLLPDNAEIRERIRNRFSVAGTDVFDLLAAIGRDCAGAIQLLPEDDDAGLEINTVPLTESQVAETLRDYHDRPLGMTGDDEDFRLSLAGAQEKTAFLLLDDQWHRPLGNTPTSHIFKLPIGPLGQFRPDLSDSVENEWLCLEILQAYGLPVAKAEIAQFEDVRVLVIERFDRRWRGQKLLRIPHEDMCQALGRPPDAKYENDGGPQAEEIFDLLLGSERSQQDRHHFLSALLMNWLLAAPDGHAKNFSIELMVGGRFQLAPFYDVVSVYPYFEQKTANPKKQKLAMAARGKNAHYRWSEIQVRHWIATARKARISEKSARTIISDLLERTGGVVEALSKSLPATVPESVSGPIFEGLRRKSKAGLSELELLAFS